MVCGCKDNKQPVEPEVKGSITLQGEASVVISDEGGSAQIAFIATADWTATTEDEWLTVTPRSGQAGETGITVTAPRNDSYDERVARVVLASGEDSKTVTVTQKQKGALLLTESNYPVGAEGGTVSVTLKANSEITAAIKDDAKDWILPAPTKGLVETVMEFTVLANESEQERSGQIVFTNESGSETITVVQEGKPAVIENPYGDAELEKITATTAWEGSVFDAIISAKAGADATEYISPDGQNFIDAKLGYLAGQTTSIDETTGEPKTTYGKFKFKKDEKAYASGTKMSRAQLGGTGVLGQRNNLQFKVAGPGTLTLTGRSSGDAARMINVAIGTTPVSETGFEVPDKASDPATLTQKLQTADGDIVSIWSMESGINLYSIKWTPEGSGQDDPDPQPGEVTSATWDFGSEAWQAALAKDAPGACAETNGNVTVNGWSVSLDGLTYTSGSGKGKWSTTGYINPSGAGSETERVFSFTAAVDGNLKVVASHTGETADESRNVTVTDAAGTTSQVGGASCLTPVTLTFPVKKGVVKIYPTGNGLRFYEISFGEGGDTPGPGEDPIPGEGAELECTNPPTEGTVDPAELVGYGASVTGGAGASSTNILHFNNGKALQTWLLARAKSEKNGDHSPVIIWLSGTFGPGDGRDFSEDHPWFDVKDVSNLSFFGTDSFVMDRIGFFCVRAQNIIIRNINFQQPKAKGSNGADAVSMQESEGIWVDHCTFTSLNQTKDYEDGSTDITHATKNVTVSWCHYIKTQKSCLVGHSKSATADKAITATFHHNWYEKSSSRHPRVRYGTVHVYNNFFDGCTTYGVGSADGAMVLVEYNYFDGVQLPTDIATYPAKESNESNLQDPTAGYLYPTQNVYVNKPAKAKDPYPLSNVAYTTYGGAAGTPLTYSDFKPSYAYTVTPAADVPSVVKAGAGHGKLSGFAEAPVAVNNGGITQFDGTPDDPTDPDDPDDPDDPVIDDGSAHVYTLYVDDSRSIKSTQDGVSGGSYFAYSTSLSDFSKDYKGAFTIGSTTYNYGLKMDSKGSVTFTTSSLFNSSVQFYFARRKSSASGVAMQIMKTGGDALYTGDSDYANYVDSGAIALEKGTGYTIQQVSGESAVILVIVRETE